MTDFPTRNVLPLFVHSYSRRSFGHLYSPVGGTLVYTSNYAAAANKAVYIPFVLPWAYPVNRVFWVNGGTGGYNVDFGIYTSSMVRLYSTGSTVRSGTSVPQYVTPATPFVLPPGRYYFGIACSGTTGAFYGNLLAATITQTQFAGVLMQATALPLPATATPTTYSGGGVPICGITRTASGF